MVKGSERKSATICLVEELYGMPIEKVLRKFYVDEQMPMRAIGKKLHLSPGTVQNWLRKSGIPSRVCKWE
jgi:transposase-like protein